MFAYAVLVIENAFVSVRGSTLLLLTPQWVIYPRVRVVDEPLRLAIFLTTICLIKTKCWIR